MSDPSRNPLHRQGSLSYLEQSINIIPMPPQQAPVTIYPGPKAGNVNLSKVDLEIADRLEKLRKKNVEVPTEEEMASRLAKLKGLPSDHYSKPSSVFYKPPDNRSGVEKSDDLLKQVMEEVALDTKVPNPDDDIGARLARLRTDRPSGHTNQTGSLGSLPEQGPSEELSEHDQVMKLIADSKREVESPAAVRVSGGSSSESPITSDGEKYSDSESEEEERKSTLPYGSKKREEVDRITKMYMQKAVEKKKKKRKRKGDLSKSTVPSDSSTSESSTSESEKLSASD